MHRMASDGNKQPRSSSVAPPPRTIHVQRFAESRASELEALHSIVSNRLKNDFKAPRNKRRRTTGHDNRTSKNRFRKKRKLGVTDNACKDERLEESAKKVPRYVRRKIELKKNPESGFCASGDGTKRLRTHVWHAKRFAMTKRWGFHLPLGLPGRGKGSKALLKWMKNGVLIHDASYHGAVQLEGPEDSLLSILSAVMEPSPLTHSEEFSHKVLSGVMFARSMLHHIGSPNASMIAPVTYMWRPHHQQFKDANNEAHGTNKGDGSGNGLSVSSVRQVWVWVHAAAFREGYDALTAACQRQGKIDKPGTLINCISLEGQLAKLEVMGSKAFQLLQKILHPATSISENSSILRGCSFKETESTDSPTQVQNASILENEDQILLSAIISLTVNDPRILAGKKDVGAASEAASTGVSSQIKGHGDKESFNLAGIAEREKESGLSMYVKRDQCCNISGNMDVWDISKGLCPPLEENILCMEKHHQRLADFCLGERSSEESNASTKEQFSRFCSILLLRSSNLKDSITRWSVILPLSWGKAFWVPLVSGGARAIGLREKRWVACEVGMPYFPTDFPDCFTAYNSSMATEAAAFDEKESLRPPSMRSLRVPNPLPWDCVSLTLKRTSTETGDAHINPNTLCANKLDCESSLTNSSGGFDSAALGDHRTVARTSNMLSNLLNNINSDHLLLFPLTPDKKTSNLNKMRVENLTSQGTDRVSFLISGNKRCLLRVRLHACKEGVFEEGAVVCAPNLTDIKLWTSGSEIDDVELQVPQSSVASYFVQQESGKWELQVPEDPKAMESHRWPVGFVTTGFVRGSKKPAAEALCEAVLLARVREEQWTAVPVKKRKKDIYVLVRNMRSTAYRLALANIVLENQVEDLEHM